MLSGPDPWGDLKRGEIDDKKMAIYGARRPLRDRRWWWWGRGAEGGGLNGVRVTVRGVALDGYGAQSA